jgi:tetratricopeptide (TPR) repeat protein
MPLGLGDHKTAEVDAGEAINLEPNAPSWRALRGQVRNRMSNYPGAIEDFSKALNLSPIDSLRSAIHKGRAESYGQSEDFENAVVDLSEAIRLNPKDDGALNDRCWYRGAWGQELDKAIADCDASLALRQNAGTLDSRGFVNLRRADATAAFKDFDAAVALDADFASAVYGRGIARLRLGQTAEGQADIVAAISKQPDVATRYAKYGFSP